MDKNDSTSRGNDKVVKRKNILLTISSPVVYLLAGLREKFWGVSGYKFKWVSFKALDAILLVKQDHFPIDLTDDLLFENLCA